MGWKAGITLCLLTAALGLIAASSFAQTPPATADSSAAPVDSMNPNSATTTPQATTPAPAAATTPPPAATTPPPAAAPPPPPPAKSAQSAGGSGPYDRGRMRGSLTVGWGRSFGQDYMLVGAGLGKYIKRGLELGLYYEGWAGTDPSVSKLTPRLTYVVTKVPRLTPYLGAFYTRTFVGNGLEDLDSAGGRAGIYKGQGRVSAGVGVG